MISAGTQEACVPDKSAYSLRKQASEPVCMKRVLIANAGM